MFSIYITIILINLGGIVLPGPDFAITLRSSVRFGIKGGVITALGIALGVWTNLGITFLIGNTLFNNFHIIYLTLVFIGILYLWSISYELIKNHFRSSSSKNSSVKTNDETLFKIFMTGFWTNLSNLKAIMFFSAVLPFLQKLSFFYITLTWITIGSMALVWFSFIAIISNHTRIKNTLLSRIKSLELVIAIAIALFGIAIFVENFKFLF